MELHPFRGILYNPASINDLFAVLAPPYDVLSPQERESYHQQHRYNVIRLSYGREEPGDTADSNWYTRAAHYLRTWLQAGVLSRDTQPSMYLCAEEYLLPDGTRRERRGLIALCRLEPYDRGIIMPHERTSPVPKRMLYDLRSTVQANLDQIFALYADDTGKIHEVLEAQRRQPPRLSFRDRQGMLHRVWAMSEAPLLREIQRTMVARWALIADGHHRYETCLDYQQAMRRHTAQWTSEEWFDFVMMYLTDIHDPGLTILPTHRLLRGLQSDFVRQLPEQLRGACRLEAFPCHTAAERETQRQRVVHGMRQRGGSAHVMGLYTGTETLWLLTYTGRQGGVQVPGAAPSEGRQILDTSLLHAVILEELLGLTVPEEAIAYTQDDAAALDLVAQGAYQVAFLLNPTKVERVVQYAQAGERLPRKSTYFYPKLLTGTVMHNS